MKVEGRPLMQMDCVLRLNYEELRKLHSLSNYGTGVVTPIIGPVDKADREQVLAWEMFLENIRNATKPLLVRFEEANHVFLGTKVAVRPSIIAEPDKKSG